MYGKVGQKYSSNIKKTVFEIQNNILYRNSFRDVPQDARLTVTAWVSNNDFFFTGFHRQFSFLLYAT